MYESGLFKVVIVTNCEVVDKHLKNIHTCADDTQSYVSFKPNSQANAVNTIEKSIADVRNWIVSNRLFINDSKTEFMIIGSRKHWLRLVWTVSVGDAMIKPVIISTKSWCMVRPARDYERSHWKNMQQSALQSITYDK